MIRPERSEEEARRRSPKPVYDYAVVAELSILHELSALAFAESEDHLARETAEKVGRLFGARRFAVLSGPPPVRRLVGSIGFSSSDEAARAIAASSGSPNALTIVFNDGSPEEDIVFFEQSRPFSERTRRLCGVLARRIEDRLAAFRLDRLRCQAEESLRESEAKYRLFVERANDIVFTLTPDGVVSYASPSWTRILGFSPDEATGKPFAAFVHPDDVAACAEAIRRVVESTEFAASVLYRVRKKDGSYRWHSASGSPVLGPDGVVCSIVGVARDVTEQKIADENLLHSRDLMRYVIEHSQSAIAVHDRNLRYLYVSRRYLEDYRVKERDVVGKHHYEVFPDLPQKWRDVHRRALAGEVLSSNSDPYVRDDGSVEWTRWECRPWHEADGTVGGIVVYTQLITDQRRMEAALRERTRDLETKNRQIECLFELSRAIERCNDQKEMVFTEAARLLRNALARTSSPVVAIAVDEADSVSASATNAVIASCDVFANGVHRGAVRIECPSGQPAFDLTGDDLALVSAVAEQLGHLLERIDAISVARERQLRLIQADKLTALGTMVAGVAHEINNPVNNVMLNASLLRDFLADVFPVLDAHRLSAGDFSAGGLPYSEMREVVPNLLHGILESSDRIKTITGDIRDSADSRTESEEESASVNVAVSASLKLCSHMDKRFRDCARISLADALPKTPCSPRRLEQIVINLVQNAWQSLHRPDACIFVSSRLDPEDGMIVVEVRDEGCGMPPGVLARIMDPFFTTRRDQGGTGLGLYVACNIAESIGGRLEFESSVGIGTAARLRLPVLAPVSRDSLS